MAALTATRNTSTKSKTTMRRVRSLIEGPALPWQTVLEEDRRPEEATMSAVDTLLVLLAGDNRNIPTRVRAPDSARISSSKRGMRLAGSDSPNRHSWGRTA